MTTLLPTDLMVKSGLKIAHAITEMCIIFTAHKRSFGQGNIFTPVCHSVHRGAWMVAPRGACVVAPQGVHGCSRGCAWLLQGGHVWDMTRYGDTINERAVRILLVGILVQY